MRKIRQIICVLLCLSLILIQGSPSVLLEARAEEISGDLEQYDKSLNKKEDTKEIEELEEDKEGEATDIVEGSEGMEEQLTSTDTADTENHENEEVSYLNQNAEYEYSVTSDGVVITKYQGNDSKVIIPEIIESQKVVKIEKSAFKGMVHIAQVICPDSIVEIGGDAFRDCTGITEIQLPHSLTKIGNNAFTNTAISKIRIPKGLDTVDINAFSPRDAGPFADCQSLKEVTFEEGTTQIANHLFFKAQSLETIEIPDTITKIHSNAFMDCTGLKNVKLSNSLELISVEAFRNCTSLTEIKLPVSLTTIGYNAFTNTAISEINIPKNLQKIELNTASPRHASPFAGCPNLKVVNFDNGVNQIVNHLFYKVETIETIKIPESVIEIQEGAFANCVGLKNVELPGSLTKIGAGAFRKCAGLTRIDLSDNITEISPEAFRECSGLTEVNLPDKLVKIGYNAFSNTDIREIVIPPNLTEVDINVFSPIQESPFAYCPNLKRAVIEEGSKVIAHSLFYKVENLEFVSLPSTLTKIDQRAFANCPNLVQLQLPDNITEISGSAFSGSPSVQLYCNYGTNTHFCNIEDRRPVNLISYAYTDFSNLAIEKDSSYEADYNGLNSNGFINVKINYHIKEEKFQNSAEKYICIVVPENTGIYEGTLYVNGTLCSDYFIQGVKYKIPINEPRGKIIFSFKPQSVTQLLNCAFYEYNLDGNIKKEMIGYENDVREFLTIITKNATSNPEFDVSGIGPKESEIGLYINDTLQKTIKTSKTGKYQTNLKLSQPTNGQTYIITAKCKTNREQEANAKLQFN